MNKCFYFGAKNSMFHMTNAWNLPRLCCASVRYIVHRISQGCTLRGNYVRNDYDYLYYWNKRYYN